jgi:hypothetical protein
MTTPAPAIPPPLQDLTARVFRAIYPEYDLHDLAGTYLALPKGTPCFTAPALAEIARQISGCEHRAPVPPETLHGPNLPRRTRTETLMHPPGPFPPPPPAASPAAPAAIAAALTRALKARGLTGIYTATAARFALISVTAAGQHHTWPAAGLTALVRPVTRL